MCDRPAGVTYLTRVHSGVTVLALALFTLGLIANELCVLHHWAPCSLSAASSFAFLPLRSGEMLNATPPKKPVYTGGESYLTRIGSARRCPQGFPTTNSFSFSSFPIRSLLILRRFTHLFIHSLIHSLVFCFFRQDPV